MTRKMIASAFALALLLGAAACSSDDDSSGGGSGDLASTLQDAAADEGEDLTDTQASCLADVMVAVLGEDEANAAAEQGSAGIEEAMTSFSEAMTGAGDVEAASEVIENLQGLSDECLSELGISQDDLDAMSELSG